MTDQISHSELVRKLFKDPRTINLSPEQVNLLHAAVGLAGEAGEVLELLAESSADQMADPTRRQRLLGELGDVSFYFEAFCQGFGHEVVSLGAQDPGLAGMTHECRLDRGLSLVVAATSLLDVVKKMLFNNREGLRDSVIRALVETSRSHRELCGSIACTQDDAREANIVKLSARYEGLRYSDKAAAARRDEG